MHFVLLWETASFYLSRRAAAVSPGVELAADVPLRALGGAVLAQDVAVVVVNGKVLKIQKLPIKIIYKMIAYCRTSSLVTSLPWRSGSGLDEVVKTAT